MILHYGELCNCFIISQGNNNRKFTINVMHLNHLKPPHPSQCKNCPPQNHSLVPKRLGITGLIIIPPDFCFPILTKPWEQRRCYRSHYIILIPCPSLLGKGRTSDQAWLIRSSPRFFTPKMVGNGSFCSCCRAVDSHVPLVFWCVKNVILVGWNIAIANIERKAKRKRGRLSY